MTNRTNTEATYYAAVATGRNGHTAHKNLAAAQKSASRMGSGRSARVVGPFTTMAEARNADVSDAANIAWVA